MDRNFMEFWGNFLLNAAKGQKQLEDMTGWFRRGVKEFDGMSELFGKAYGLDRLKEENSDENSKAWKQAEESFRKSWNDCMVLFGMVPRVEYLALVRKYEGLKEKAASQEETIGRLRMLLSEGKGLQYDYEGANKQFEGVIQKQGEQIRKLMDDFGRMFKEEPSPGEGGEENT